jgi:hypothetical protein
VTGFPLLIQTATSPQAMLTDVVASGCGVVAAGRPRTALVPLDVQCTRQAPQRRVMVLPIARRLVIRGVAGVPVVNFPRHVCRASLCVTPLG